MRVYWAVLKLYLKTALQYRAVFLASLIGDPLTHLIHIAFFTALYSYNRAHHVLGYTLSQLIWYFAGISLVWQCIWNEADKNLPRKILSGDLAVDLLRPVSYFQFELADAVAGRLLGFVFEFLPALVIYSLLFFPSFLTPAAFLKFILVIPLSFGLFFLINYLIGLTAFRLQNNFSVQSIKVVVISVAAGGYIPFEFFPDWFRHFLGWLPFQYLFYWPIQVFLNQKATRGSMAFLQIVGMQLFWIAVLFWLCRTGWRRAIRKYCAAGG